ncbi:MAG: glycoside hydrolase family 20 zincin-like fold domain-containing protein [Verrucomicrobiae bacterium]|nr:glycoside hydrolase family 20 zincin-like fold domain-containing protein [Verrucomicrobiae bacterium]
MPALPRGALVAFFAFAAGGISAASNLKIIPQPREVVATGADFVLNSNAARALGKPDDEQDQFAFETLREDLWMLWGVKLPAKGKRLILIGIPSRDASVRAACEQRGLKVAPELGDEGYVLDVNPTVSLPQRTPRRANTCPPMARRAMCRSPAS